MTQALKSPPRGHPGGVQEGPQTGAKAQPSDCNLLLDSGGPSCPAPADSPGRNQLLDLTLASLDQAKVTQACGKNRDPCWVEKAGGAVLWGDAAYDRRSLGCPCAWAAPAIELAHGHPLDTQARGVMLLLGWRAFKGEAAERSHRCSSFSAPCSRQGPLPWVDPASLLPSLPLRGP